MNEYDELCEYADADGSELGEYCQSLLHLRQFSTDHGMGEKLDHHITMEITRLLIWFKGCSELKEVTETRSITYKKLLFNDE